MAGTKQVVEYNNFSGGEFGLHDKWNAPRNSFTGKNMLVYRTGELGVRSGLRDISPPGLVAGTVWKLAPLSPFSRGFVWFGQGSAVRRFEAGGLLTTFGTGITGGTNPTGPDQVGRYETGSHFYFVTNTGAGLYQGTGTTLTKLSGTPTSNVLALYGDRLVVSQPDDTIRYNGLTAGVSDLTSWPATNTIPVGDDTGISGLHTQRGHLSIMKLESGNYILSGALGVNEVLRQANVLSGPHISQNSTRAYDEQIWFLPTNTNYPTSWDGSNYRDLWYLTLPDNGSSSSTVEPLQTDIGDVIVVGEVDGWCLVYSHGIWTRHQFGASFISSAAGALSSYLSDPSGSSDSITAGYYVMTDGGGASEIPKFYGWSPGINRPGSETFFQFGIPERAGDLSAEQVSGEVAFPIWSENSGSEFIVKGVEVDFRSWNTGGSLTNHFDLQVDAYHRFDGDAPVSSLKESWDEAGSVSSSGGTAKRQVFRFGDQGFGNGFQLRFTNVRGVAFQRIHVILELRPPRGI